MVCEVKVLGKTLATSNEVRWLIASEEPGVHAMCVSYSKSTPQDPKGPSFLWSSLSANSWLYQVEFGVHFPCPLFLPELIKNQLYCRFHIQERYSRNVNTTSMSCTGSSLVGFIFLYYLFIIYCAPFKVQARKVQHVQRQKQMYNNVTTKLLLGYIKGKKNMSITIKFCVFTGQSKHTAMQLKIKAPHS